MLALLAAATIGSSQEAVSLLKGAQQFYAGLKRFEATIEHHDDSGLFPGEYTQKLVWTGKGMFDLKVTKASNHKPKEDRPGNLAPNYVADGKMVNSTWPDGRTTTDSVIPRENTSPGWEVSGGLAISFLEKTKIVSYLLEPPAEFKLTWSMGKTTSWEGQDVRELVAEFGGRDRKMRLFLDKSKPMFVGAKSEGGLNGWMIYRDVKAQ
ncbi:MAG: hypothetical protein HONBIEJF_01735 [Fimbriimonadaceae bacterium]|nr:hypothetical protein [Fimbriimonadaceae bacterium]